MELYFLRHAEAAANVTMADDSKRPLTAGGIEAMRKIARGMKEMGLSFDKVFSSSYTRARHTAEIAAQGVGFKGKIEFSEALVPGADFKDFFKLLEKLEPEEKILFVGHQPILGEFISELISGGKKVLIDLKKGGLCRVDTSELGPGVLAELEWFLTPEQISGLV